MGSRGLERNYVGAPANSVNVAGICGVPERGGMALVGLGGEQELQSHVGGGGRMAEEGVRLVVGADVGAQVPGVLLWAVLARRIYVYILAAGGGLTLLAEDLVLLGDRERGRGFQLVIELRLERGQLAEAAVGGSGDGVDLGREEATERGGGSGGRGAREDTTSWGSLA